MGAYGSVGVSFSDQLDALRDKTVRIFANGSVETVTILDADESFVKAINVKGVNTGSLKIYNILNIDYVELI
ncbi:hypothetical protein [Halobacillus sp. K22]|uniref:hypothetical protein n=1 Tax=Halobacillus sp. K22 TaxID=3457431 RepID=UPI003FCD65E2